MPPLRLLSWNVENLTRYIGPAAYPPLAEFVGRFGNPELVCLQEIRLRAQDGEQFRAMETALPGYVCKAALARDPRNAAFRGGRTYGVVTYVRDTLHAKLSTFDEDREGRLVLCELSGPGLAIFNLYAVNGTSKPYYDHTLGRIEGDRHAFKRRFQEFLIQQGKRCAEKHLKLIMIGDWNVSRTAQDIYPRLRTATPHALARRQLNQELMPALDVVDVFRELHPHARQYTWFNRLAPPGMLDAARVDYALISSALLPEVLSADIREAPAERHRSDHAPLTLTLRG